MIKNALLLFILPIIILFFVRFLFLRLPKDIPFSLDGWHAVMLFLLCTSLLLVLVMLLFSKKPKTSSIKRNFLRPLLHLDNLLRKTTIFSEKLRPKILFLLNYLQKKPATLLYLYYLIQIYLTVVFVLEIFIYKRLDLFYKSSILFLLIYASNYYKYVLAGIKEELLEDIKIGCNFHWGNIAGKIISLKQLLLNLVASTTKYGEPIQYGITFDPEYISNEVEKLNQGRDPWDLLRFNTPKILKEKRENILLVTSIITYQIKYEEKNLEYKKWRILLLLIKIFCWSYILMKSLHTLPENSFDWLKYLLPLYEENSFGNLPNSFDIILEGKNEIVE